MADTPNPNSGGAKAIIPLVILAVLVAVGWMVIQKPEGTEQAAIEPAAAGVTTTSETAMETTVPATTETSATVETAPATGTGSADFSGNATGTPGVGEPYQGTDGTDGTIVTQPAPLDPTAPGATEPAPMPRGGLGSEPHPGAPEPGNDSAVINEGTTSMDGSAPTADPGVSMTNPDQSVSDGEPGTTMEAPVDDTTRIAPEGEATPAAPAQPAPAPAQAQ